jgi:ribosomal-protein-alanine N-acetyltransferase
MMVQTEPEIALRPERMEMADVEEVCRIERRSFTNPWPLSAYRRELRRPEHNSYFVLRALPIERLGTADNRAGRGRFLESILPVRRGDPAVDLPHLAGYVGMWHMYDETHVTTIAVDPPYRGRGYGELLLLTAIAEAMARSSAWLSLEVRVTNQIAQALYEKYGMMVYGRRAAYYTDNREDALVMWSRSLRDPEYFEQLSGWRGELARRLPGVEIPELVFRPSTPADENEAGPPHG